MHGSNGFVRSLPLSKKDEDRPSNNGQDLAPPVAKHRDCFANAVR